MIESDCEFPIIYEMEKVIEEGVNYYLIYLIGIDVHNPYLEQLLKNDFYTAAMKSVIQGASHNISPDIYSYDNEKFFEKNNQ